MVLCSSGFSEKNLRMEYKLSSWLPILKSFGDQALMTKLSNGVNHVNDPASPQLAIYAVNIRCVAEDEDKPVSEIFSAALPALAGSLGASEWTAFYGLTTISPNADDVPLKYFNQAGSKFHVFDINPKVDGTSYMPGPNLFTHMSGIGNEIQFQGIILAFTTKP